MRILSIVTILLSFVANTGIASILTPEQALKRIESSKFKARRSMTSDKLQLRHTLSSSADIPYIYVFEREDNGGCLFLSADDRAMPLLGYTETGAFDISNMPPQMVWWLSEYNRQIEYASDKGAYPHTSETLRNERKSVAPLLKTKLLLSAKLFFERLKN